MAEFRRAIRIEKTQRQNPFGPSVVTVTEDEYTIEAETAGEICVILQASEREKHFFLQFKDE